MRKILTVFVLLIAISVLIDVAIRSLSDLNERTPSIRMENASVSDGSVPAPEPVTDVPSEDRPVDSIPSPAPAPEPASKRAVPFVVQAPGGAWNDPVFQDGCEEASMLMASLWITDMPAPSASGAANIIRSLAASESKRLGYDRDLSLADVVATLSEYFSIDSAVIAHDITLPDLRDLAKRTDTIILVPVYGQSLGNPFFTAPGPITHMLVVTDYDETKHEFVTNDPGTRRGQDFRYDENVLFGAIWNYPAGKTHPDPPTSAARPRSVVVVRLPRT